MSAYLKARVISHCPSFIDEKETAEEIWGGSVLLRTKTEHNGGVKASRKYPKCHNKEICEKGKSRLHRTKAFLEEKPLSSESTLISLGILVNPNNRLRIGTSGDVSSSDLLK